MNEKYGGVSVCVTPDRDFRAWCDGRGGRDAYIRLVITVDMESSGGMMHMHKASILSQRTGGYEPFSGTLISFMSSRVNYRPASMFGRKRQRYWLLTAMTE